MPTKASATLHSSESFAPFVFPGWVRPGGEVIDISLDGFIQVLPVSFLPTVSFLAPLSYLVDQPVSRCLLYPQLDPPRFLASEGDAFASISGEFEV